MILRHLHVDGFGKLADFDLELADGINLICGDNEAGKTTLCSFVFHMLYGLERSRGKASRFDAYVRYLPWHGARYGGSLTFESKGSTWLLERSFLVENRFLRLIRLDDGFICSDAESLLDDLRGQVIEHDYQTLFTFSQQNSSDLPTLSATLRQYTQNLPGSRSVSFSASNAVKSLNRQQKELSAQLSGFGKGDLYRVEEELSRVRNRLQVLTSDLAMEDPIKPIESEVSTGRHRRFPYLLAILLFFSSVAGLLYPPISSLLPNGPLHFLPSTLCFAGGLLVVLSCYLASKKTPHSDYDEPSDSDLDCDSDSASAMISHMLEQEEFLANKYASLVHQLKLDNELQHQIDAIRLAVDTISTLSSDIHHTYCPDLQRTFARHASALTGRPFSQIVIDESFHFSLIEDGHLVPLEALSHGTIEQLIFSCRLASIQLLYPDASLPLLMDDIFALTDDSRLSVLLSRLSMDLGSQMLIFSCQKREAAILSQHSLPHHLIQL